MLTPPSWQGAKRLAALTLALTLTVAACSGDDEPETAAGPEMVGPLCDLLPQPGDPGGPDALVDEPADVALTWIPVGTNFEAGTRSSGLDAELNTAEAVTILVPSDDAFDAAMSQDTIDQLLLFDHDQMRTLLESHIIDGRMTLDELIAAGTVTTRSGETLTISTNGNMARFNDRSETICAGYEVANATIHVVDGVLGVIPEPAPEADPGVG